MFTEPRLIVALDFTAGPPALRLAERLDPVLCRLKVGKGLFTRTGPSLVEQLMKRGFEVFLDLKFHDIPTTVAAACQAAAELGVWMVNVHALGGRPMLEAARDALANRLYRPLLIAVTVLTSLEQAELHQVGILDTPREQSLRLARLAWSAGLDGVVCSGHEAGLLRSQLGRKFCLVTPGIRLAGVAADDQRRVMTPREAVRAGADYLVIGRPVREAADPLALVQALYKEVG